ncbi:MAG: hypothetical protein ACJ71R_06870 [Nitrososphaeraceae archaeon]
MVHKTTLAIVAIVAAAGALGLMVVIGSINIPEQQAEARGCDILSGEHTFGSSTAFNASSGRCFGH